MKRSINTSFAVSILVALLFVAGYVMFFVVIKHTNEEVSLLTHEVDIYAAREAMLRDTDKLAGDLKEDIQKLGTYFLTKDDVVSFIETVEQAGVTSGVDLTIGSVDVIPQVLTEGQLEDTHETLTLRVDAVGSWSGIFTFLEYIQHMPYNIQINRVSVSKVSSVVPFFGGKEDVGQKVPQWNSSFEIQVRTIQ